MEYSVKTIPRTEQGIAFNLEYYKPFRLRALQTDPSAFSSTYAREVSYTDKRWNSRLLKSPVTTLVAVANANSDQNQDDKLKVLSSTSVVGPVATPPELTRKKHAGKEDQPTPAPLNWEINAVWTAPEARRHGIARRLLREAIHQAQTQAAALARGKEDTTPAPDLFLTVGVAGDNTAALSLYTQSGYVPFPKTEVVVEGEHESTYLYLPVPYPGVSEGAEGE